MTKFKVVEKEEESLETEENHEVMNVETLQSTATVKEVNAITSTLKTQKLSWPRVVGGGWEKIVGIFLTAWEENINKSSTIQIKPKIAEHESHKSDDESNTEPSMNLPQNQQQSRTR